MDAIDALIDAAQTFYDDARANENGRSRSWERLLSRLPRCANRPFPGLRLFEPAPRFLPGELGDVSGFVLPASEGLQGAVARCRGGSEA